MKLTTRHVTLAAALIAAGAAQASAGTTQPYKGAELAPQARIGIAEARGIALAAQPGTITAEELEKENGGSGIRYSFDVRSAGQTHEVGVDARTGRLLENSVEGPDAD